MHVIKDELDPDPQLWEIARKILKWSQISLPTVVLFSTCLILTYFSVSMTF
jgi:hypothetical protein